MTDFFNPIISEETFAAWLDGGLTSEQEAVFLDACLQNEELQELLDANDQIEEDYENLLDNGYFLPSEFEEDFEIPQITDASGEEDLYSDNQIEPYEQEDEDDYAEEGIVQEDDESNYLSDIDAFDGDIDSISLL